MNSSDDDYIAPVINLFADRSSAAHADVVEPASEESSPEEEWAAEPAAEPLAVLRALPTMRDFSSSHDEEEPPLETRREPRFVADPVFSEAAVAADHPANGSATAESHDGSSRKARKQARDGFSEISRVSMRALARRGMSSHEMTQFLGTREFESEEIEAEIERLEGSALLDDAALAETLTRTLRERKGLGSGGIIAELRRRKIDQEHIDAVVDFERDEEQERANEVALKRAPQLRSLDNETAKRRLSGFLLRRGYSGSVVSSAVTTALAPGGGASSHGPRFR
ncbi:regulatory protein RecX [Salinibacterium sp. NK8237]|uniref:regulatory protein RecX n=1 Tax=Salinibacterium sp. NK8237 TaxID=2792038 RepID=UPI0018CE4B52|nr:regulatory protein RecX [Salinibacterium sp. NK8237]MBH0131582.1 RecX family transcriptional regulator [Salinibacterium sp. NK8237]